MTKKLKTYKAYEHRDICGIFEINKMRTQTNVHYKNWKEVGARSLEAKAKTIKNKYHFFQILLFFVNKHRFIGDILKRANIYIIYVYS